MVIAKIPAALKKQKEEAENRLVQAKIDLIKKKQMAVLNKMEGVGKWLDDFEKDFKEPFKFNNSTSVTTKPAGLEVPVETTIRFDDTLTPRLSRDIKNQSYPPSGKPFKKGVYEKNNGYAIMYLGKRLGTKLCVMKDVPYDEYPKRRRKANGPLEAQTGYGWDCIAPGGRTTYRVTHDGIKNLQSKIVLPKIFGDDKRCFLNPSTKTCKPKSYGGLEDNLKFYASALPLVEKFESLVRNERQRREEFIGNTLKEIEELEREAANVSTTSLLI